MYSNGCLRETVLFFIKIGRTKMPVLVKSVLGSYIDEVSEPKPLIIALSLRVVA